MCVWKTNGGIICFADCMFVVVFATQKDDVVLSFDRISNFIPCMLQCLEGEFIMCASV